MNTGIKFTLRKWAILLIAMTILVPTSILARAGGGHGGGGGSSSSNSHSSSSNYSTSSSSHSSSSSTQSCSIKYAWNPEAITSCETQNSSSTSQIFWMVFILILILILGVICIWIIFGVTSAVKLIKKTIHSLFGKWLMDNSSRINSNLGTYTDAVIYENDPLWNKQKFIELVNVGFFKIQNAWCSGEMSGAQAYISDGILRRFNMQLEPYRAKNQKNVLGQLSLDNVQILEIHKDELYTYIATLITATCTDTIVDFDTNEVVEKNYGGELTTWREKWIWMRSNAAKTEETENGVFADKCPNCGATLKINAVGKCEYCLSELTKWDFDWVLSEIEQVGE